MAPPVRTKRSSSFSTPKDFRLDDIKKDINKKIGRFAVRSGDTLILSDIYADEANAYDICDITGKMCFCKKGSVANGTPCLTFAF